MPASIRSPITVCSCIRRRSACVEQPALAEDRVGDADLADVVEEEAVLDARVAVERAGVDLRQQAHRVRAHALRVARAAEVLRLERARERRDGRLERVRDQ